MTKRYPFLDLALVNEPYMDEMCLAAQRVIRSGRYIGGEEVIDFQRELGRYLNVPYVVGVSNGLDALRLILRALIELGRLTQGDKVIVPANTYIASVLAITDAGLTPVLTDPDPTTLNISAQSISTAIDTHPDIKAVMPVHLYGRVAWGEDIRKIISDNNLLVIEDSAQAIGARSHIDGLYSGHNSAGALGHAAAFSFYPTKNTGALGDAGAVTTHDKSLADTVRALANYGADRRYHNVYQGYNCRLDPLQAAMLRVKLPHNDDENRARMQSARLYDQLITHPDVVKPPLPEFEDECVWHQYVIRIKNGNRDLMQKRLGMAGVETDIHYAVPLHLQPCYAQLSHVPLPVTEMTASELLSLPIARGTTLEDVAAIAEIINNVNIRE